MYGNRRIDTKRLCGTSHSGKPHYTVNINSPKFMALGAYSLSAPLPSLLSLQQFYKWTSTLWTQMTSGSMYLTRQHTVMTEQSLTTRSLQQQTVATLTLQTQSSSPCDFSHNSSYVYGLTGLRSIIEYEYISNLYVCTFCFNRRDQPPGRPPPARPRA